MEELDARALRVHEGVVHGVGGDHSAQRHGGRGDRLGEHHQIGLDAEVLRRERSAEASEAGDHLVEDEQDAVLARDLAQPREVALGRHQHPARARDRLDDHRGDVLRAVQRDDALLELVRELGAALGAAAHEGARLQVLGVAQVVDAAEQRTAVGFAVERHAAHRNPGEVDAVIALLAPDEARA